MSTKVKDLAAELLGKSPEQKALDALTDQVEKNENDFRNDEFAAKNRVKEAKKALAALNANPNARARQIIDARDEVKIAERELEQITEIIEERF